MVLEEAFLCLLERWVLEHIIWNFLCRVNAVASVATCLLQLCVAELRDFGVILNAVELGVRLNHLLLFVLRETLKTADWLLGVLHAHSCCTCLLQSRLSLLCRILFLCNTVWIVLVSKLGPARHLVATFERIALTIGLWPLEKSARLRTEDILSVKAVRLHLVFSPLHAGEDTKTLG